jgi:P4 family phage/plasmid primase-like protien
MSTVHEYFPQYEETPATIWASARDNLQPLFPERTLQEALEDLEWFGWLTPENLEPGYGFAREHDLYEQDPADMDKLVAVARVNVAALKAREVEKERKRAEYEAEHRAKVISIAPRRPALSPEEEDRRNRVMLAQCRRQYPPQEQGWTMAFLEASAKSFERGDHVELGERLLTLQRATAETTFSEGEFHRYDDILGIFSPVTHPELSRMVQGFAGKWVAAGKKKGTEEITFKPLKIKAADVKGVISLAADQAEQPDFFAKAKPGIAFLGSFVEVTPSGIVVHEPSPEHRARVAYDFDYEPNRTPMLFLKMLHEVFRDDDDRDDKIAFLQEHAGMSLIGRGTQFQKAALEVGFGENGKSAVTKIIEGAFPAGSVIAVPPQKLDEEYQRATFSGAKLNSLSELPENEISASEPWKAMIDGSIVGARNPYGRPFFFKPTAGHVYSANRLPGTTDHTRGFWRRWVVITFNRAFTPDEQDSTLPERILATERPAIVSWFLQGAQRALANDGYTIPTSSEKAKAKWMTVADQVSAFVDAECEKLKAGTAFALWAKADKVYEAYRAWAQRCGHASMSLTKFGERMQGLGLGASPRQGTGFHYPVRILLKGEVSPANEHYEHFSKN